MQSEAPQSKAHPEDHRVHRVSWLRAAVLGANDGIVSTSSLIIGIAAAGTDRSAILLAGTAGLVAGAMSMAAGEYVSVSSQGDAESADIERERRELKVDPVGELRELADIFVQRGLSPDLAMQVADEMTEHDALAAHAREELGISEITVARPVQAAVTSALTFSLGAALPLAAAAFVPLTSVIAVIAVLTLFFLAGLGVLGAKAGGAPLGVAAFRVTFWGAAAMAATFLVGNLFDTAVA